MNKTGVSKTPAVSYFAASQQCDFLSLQEVDVNLLSASGYCAGWQSRGYKAILSELDVANDLHRVALVTRLPIKPVSLNLGVRNARVAAGLTELGTSNGFESVLVVALYGFSGDLPATNQLVQEVVASCKSFGGTFMIVGDYNCTQHEGTVCNLLQAGWTCPS